MAARVPPRRSRRLAPHRPARPLRGRPPRRRARCRMAFDTREALEVGAAPERGRRPDRTARREPTAENGPAIHAHAPVLAVARAAVDAEPRGRADRDVLDRAQTSPRSARRPRRAGPACGTGLRPAGRGRTRTLTRRRGPLSRDLAAALDAHIAALRRASDGRRSPRTPTTGGAAPRSCACCRTPARTSSSFEPLPRVYTLSCSSSSIASSLREGAKAASVSKLAPPRVQGGSEGAEVVRIGARARSRISPEFEAGAATALAPTSRTWRSRRSYTTNGAGPSRCISLPGPREVGCDGACRVGPRTADTRCQHGV